MSIHKVAEAVVLKVNVMDDEEFEAFGAGIEFILQTLVENGFLPEDFEQSITNEFALINQSYDNVEDFFK